MATHDRRPLAPSEGPAAGAAVAVSSLEFDGPCLAETGPDAPVVVSGTASAQDHDGMLDRVTTAYQLYLELI